MRGYSANLEDRLSQDVCWTQSLFKCNALTICFQSYHQASLLESFTQMLFNLLDNLN